MKKHIVSMMLLIAVGSILFTSCKKNDDTDDTTNPETRSASFKIGSNTFNVIKPYLGIFNDNGTIKNTMTLTASDGSKVEFHFTGSSPATYVLQSYSNAYYKNAAGKQYNSTSGELIISNYSITDNTYMANGTFHFKAKAITAPIDSLEITVGVITNASNLLSK